MIADHPPPLPALVGNDMSSRAIIGAFASADPPGRKKIHREPAALDGLRGHIDAMLEANPETGTAAIWERGCRGFGPRNPLGSIVAPAMTRGLHSWLA